MKLFPHIALFFLFLSGAHAVKAEVKLPVLVSDGMVLQRDHDIHVWGWADPGEEVKISFRNKTWKVQADRQGNWKAVLPPQRAGGPYTMTVNHIRINNILVGDVWLCSGQSNMELPIRRVTDLYQDEVERYSNPMIRHISVPMAYDFHRPQTDIQPSSWKALTPENALSFSAVGYFFAQDLYEKIKVPVGLINSSVGGSPAEAWISEEGLAPFPEYLNEKQICESDEYVREVKQLDRKERHLWTTVLNRNDAGLNGAVKWSDPALDDRTWQTADLLDTSFGSDGVNPVNGSFWFRKEFDVAKGQAGKKATLRLGCIVDADSVFVNGTFVGTTSYQYPPRIYTIPEGLLKEGTNRIAIRLVSYSGYPRFVKDKPYRIVFGADDMISLEGTWKVRQGTQMPPLRGETFFHYKPSGLYNGMIHPLKDYPVKGVLWYQGESNTGRYNGYYGLMPALIGNWRSLWADQDMPFLMVQLTSFMEASSVPSQSRWAALRDVQLQVSRDIPNTGLAVTIDIGEWNDIHPLNKKDVGKRLSLQAQRIAYSLPGTIADGPVYQSKTIEGDKVILSFREGTDDLMPVDGLKGFAVAGPDGQFRWARARIEKNKVVVWHDEISNPVMVRYAWADNPGDANLRNRSGLPASPFRTDK